MRYSTKQAAVTDIVAAIEAGDATADAYDVDAIFDEAYTWAGDGFDQVVDVDEFWTIVERHAR